ncbi:MAG: hypothetical protein K0Q59_2010 [Paenibacillus sp.]|jgi:hypothetical protein|nr:hypothetical protein [Paenibacillus sp.]
MDSTQEQPHSWTRRKLLALGAVSVVGAAAATVSQIVPAYAATPLSSVRTTIAELRASTTASSDTQYVVSDAGQEGIFYYDAADTSTADNTGLVIVSTAGLRYKRSYTGELNAKWFGAKGDGTTNDTTALQAAISAMPAATIVIPAGTYLVGELTVSSHITLLGLGNVVIKGSVTGGAVISLQASSTKIALQSFKVDAALVSKSGIVINSGCSQVTIDSVEVANVNGDTTRGGYGILLENGAANIGITGCYIHDVAGYEDGVEGNSPGASRGIHIRAAQQVRISRCLFERIDGFEDGDMIQVHGVAQTGGIWNKSDVLIEGNRFIDFKKRAVKIQASGVTVRNNVITSTHAGSGSDCAYSGISAFDADSILIEGNRIDLTRSRYGIEADGIVNSTITGNDIRVDVAMAYPNARAGGQNGISLFGGSRNSVVTGNTIACAYRGIFINDARDNLVVNSNLFRYTAQYSVFVQDSSGLLLNGNIFEGGSTYSRPYQCMTLTECGNVQVTGNLFTKGGTAIRLYTTIGKLVLFGNIFSDFTTKLMTTDLNTGEDAHIFVGEGQI